MAKPKEKKPTIAAYKTNPVFDYALLAAFAVFIVFFTTFKISGDDDVFWHLATGRYIVAKVSPVWR